jgi:GTP-binding protein
MSVVDARFLFGVADPSALPKSELPEVAFAGRSNVGKSSLLNALASRKNLARTSSTPGCTRQINIFELRLGDGLRVRLVDLPGFGYAKRSKLERQQWGKLIEGYLERGGLCALVLLADVRRGLQEEELQLFEFMRVVRGPDFPSVIVLTKADKVSRGEVSRAVEAVKRAVGVRAIAFSVSAGQGREALWREIRRRMMHGAVHGPAQPGAMASQTEPPQARR